MSKKAQKDLERAVKAIAYWRDLGVTYRADFHAQRAEQKMLEHCLNFVDCHHRSIAKMLDQPK